MRIKEIVLESEDYPEFDLETNPIEDEADTRGDASLITALEYLRNEAEQSNAVTPRVKVDTVIKRVRNVPGNEAFNYAALDKAQKDNDVVKGMIKRIEDDPHTGEKYVYLAPAENTVDDSDPIGANTAQAGDPSKVVSQMAKRAATK
jgi:hypothetical protein